MIGDPAGKGAALRIVFLGTPDAAVPTLLAVAAAGHDVALVVTRPDRRRGRGGHPAPSPVKAAALRAGLPVLLPEKVNDPESVERVRAAGADVLLIVAYGQILRRPLIEACRMVPLNLHFSLLPEYRGAAPVVRAIADGRTGTGVTLQRIVRKLDAGPVLAARSVAIRPEETAGELEARLAGIGADLVVATLARLARGEVEETPQDDERATLAPMLTKRDGLVDFSRPAVAIANHVRAMNPWPGAQATLGLGARGRKIALTILRARPEPGRAGGSPGEILEAGPEGLLVATGDGALALVELKPAGKRALTAREFVNGYRPAPGDEFCKRVS